MSISHSESLSANIVYEGWIEKKGRNKMSQFNKRYLILYSDQRLKYYTSKGNGLKGTIDLSETENISSYSTKSSKAPYGFRVNTPNRVYWFGSYTKDERTQWLQNLKVVLNNRDVGFRSDSINSSFSQQRINYDKIIQDLRTEVETLKLYKQETINDRQIIKELKNENESYKNEIVKLKNNINSLNDQIKIYEKSQNESQNNNDKTLQELLLLKKQNERLDNQIIDKNFEIKKLNDQINDLKQTIKQQNENILTKNNNNNSNNNNGYISHNDRNISDDYTPLGSSTNNTRTFDFKSLFCCCVNKKDKKEWLLKDDDL